MVPVFITLIVLSVFCLGWRHSPAVLLADEVPPPSPHGTRIDLRIDLYGNEVAPAVGDYRIDGLGNMYEEHAPDTALLKLGPPST